MSEGFTIRVNASHFSTLDAKLQSRGSKNDRSSIVNDRTTLSECRRPAASSKGASALPVRYSASNLCPVSLIHIASLANCGSQVLHAQLHSGKCLSIDIAITERVVNKGPSLIHLLSVKGSKSIRPRGKSDVDDACHQDPQYSIQGNKFSSL